jgi:hypothetical protein
VFNRNVLQCGEVSKHVVNIQSRDLKIQHGTDVHHARLDACWHAAASGAVLLQHYRVFGMVSIPPYDKTLPEGRQLYELQENFKV